jgi:CBS domain-containing protein
MVMSASASAAEPDTKTVADVMRRDVVTCRADQPVEAAARKMWETDLRALPVVDSRGQTVGVLTDRAIALAAYTTGQPLTGIRVQRAMANDVPTVQETTPVTEAWEILQRYGVAALAVVDLAQRAVGVVSEPDLRNALAEEVSQSAPSGSPLAEAVEPPEGPLRILAVDDDANTLIAVRELLLMSFPGVQVTTVTDPITAVSMARKDPPDLVITDLHMPDPGGAGVVAALRDDPLCHDVPIIVVTGQGSAADWRGLKALGADRFLVKPLEFETLEFLITQLTGHRAESE